MHVLGLAIELRIPSSQSLKQKRASIRPIVDGLRKRFEISVAETGHQDSWQRCDLGVALVSADVHAIENLAVDVERFVWSAVDIEVLRIERHWLEVDR